MGGETALREMGAVDLLEALDYVALLVELRPTNAPRAAVRWHGRLETEAPMLTMAEAQLVLAALAALPGGPGFPTGGINLRGAGRRPRERRGESGASCV
jgi:hypothetical protein